MPTTPTLLLPYPAPADPPDVPTDMAELATRIEAVRGAANGLAALDATGKVPATQIVVPTYGTTPPASPTDGQEWMLPVGTSGIVWRFRYNTGSASAHKWEFLGGAALTATVSAGEGLAVTSAWQDAATVGPQVTVARAGDYLVSGSCSMYSTTASAELDLGIASGAVNPVDPRIAVANGSAANNSSCLAITPTVFLGLTAGANIRLRYAVSVGTGLVQRRMLSVTPVRVS